MLLLYVFITFLSPQQPAIPYKPKEEYEAKLNYEFKKREGVNRYKVDYSETVEDRAKSSSAALLPYLVVNINVLQLPSGEVRAKVTDHEGKAVLNKKIAVGDVVKIDMGFTDDLKDRVSSHEYTVVFLDSEKRPVNRIHLLVEESGTFMVNGEVKGKF